MVVLAAALESPPTMSAAPERDAEIAFTSNFLSNRMELPLDFVSPVKTVKTRCLAQLMVK
jgi:hypothetical protein